MVNIVRVIWAIIMSVYGYFFIKDYRQVSAAGELDDVSVGKAGFVGFATNFFDTLGIGSFAPTVALNKFMKMGVRDKELPGLLNVADTLPVMCEAVIFTTVIEVDPVTLISMLAAAALGSYLGAGVIAKMDEVKIQKVMGVALLITAILMICKQLGLIQGGGNAIGLTGAKLVIAVVGNFILGALMSAGIGLYAPCMAMVALLGMNPKAAFPIMMGSCAFVGPIACTKFVKEGAYVREVSMGITIGGIVGSILALKFVTNLPVYWLNWLVVAVVLYTAVTMFKSAVKKDDENKLENQAS